MTWHAVSGPGESGHVLYGEPRARKDEAEDAACLLNGAEHSEIERFRLTFRDGNPEFVSNPDGTWMLARDVDGLTGMVVLGKNVAEVFDLVRDLVRATVPTDEEIANGCPSALPMFTRQRVHEAVRALVEHAQPLVDDPQIRGQDGVDSRDTETSTEETSP